MKNACVKRLGRKCYGRGSVCAQFFMFVVAMFAVVSAFADVLVVDDDAVCTLSSSASYEAMDVRGALSVVSGTISVPLVNVGSSGASGESLLVVSGTGAKLGESNGGLTDATTINLCENGGWARLVCKDGGSLCAKSVNIRSKAQCADSGYVDFARVEEGTMSLRSVANDSSVTARVVFAGGVYTVNTPFYAHMFTKGSFVIEGEDGATMAFDTVGVPVDAFNAAGISVLVQGASDCSFDMRGANKDVNFRSGAIFNQTGKLIGKTGQLRFCSGAATGESFGGIELVSGARLYIENGASVMTPSITASEGSELSGDGCLTIRVQSEVTTDYSLAFAENATVALKKVGSGGLNVRGVEWIPSLEVDEGTVTFLTDVRIGRLALAEGVHLIVDGCSVVSESLEDDGATVSCVNGGELPLSLEAGKGDLLFDRNAFRSYGMLTKTGQGTAVLYDPTEISGTVRVEEGVLSFSKLGLSDQYFRFTFKEVLRFWYGGQYSDYKQLDCKVAFYDTEGKKCPVVNVYAAAAGTKAADLKIGHISVPTDVKYAADWPKNDIRYLFKTDTVNSPRFDVILSDPTVSAQWQEVTLRLPEGMPPLDGFNLYSPWDFGNLTTWTIESSSTGEEGSWKVVSAEQGARLPEMQQNNCYWLNGDENSPAYKFRYIEPGVTGLAESLTVRVDSGAVLDFTSKSGGQVVNALELDPAKGGGVFSNIVFATSGQLRVVNYAGRVSDLARELGELPWTFSSVGGVENLKNWSVLLHGKEYPNRLSFKDGRVCLSQNGWMVFIR